MSGFQSKQVKGSNCNELLPNPDGSINVIAKIVDDLPSGVTQDPTSIFGESLSVASGAAVTVVTYTVPLAKKFYLQRVEYGGSNIATYELLRDGDVIARERTWFTGPLSDVMEFGSDPKNGLKLNGGTILTLRVTNFRPSIGDFEGRIHGILEG